MSTIGKEGGESRSLALRAARMRRAQEQAAARAAAGSPMDREVMLGNGQSMRPTDRLVGRTVEHVRERTLERLSHSVEQRDMA